MAWKADADKIVQVIDKLAGARWLDSRKRQWPNHLYYFGDIRNIAQALRLGSLYSRDQCRVKMIDFIDGADQAVIEQSPWAHKYVRLYFRPHTPTLFHQEGIRPYDKRINGAHCGVPVFLLFNSRAILAQNGVGFVDGNFGSARNSGDAVIRYTATDLASLPFSEIYHDEHLSTLSHTEKTNIIHRRHAEVVCLNELTLNNLDEIVCRTIPERETLLRLLGDDARYWETRVRLEAAGERLFFRSWLRVDDIRYDGTLILLGLRLPEEPNVMYSRVRVRAWTDTGRLLKDMEKQDWRSNSQIKVRLPANSTDVVRFCCEIEDALAYDGLIARKRIY